MYYRVATRLDSALHWHWESRVIATPDVLLRVLRLYRTMPCDHICVFFSSSVEQGFSQMMRRVHLDCKSSFMESRDLECFLLEARMQRVEWMVKESKRPSGRRGAA
jgi:hypothetical protein